MIEKAKKCLLVETILLSGKKKSHHLAFRKMENKKLTFIDLFAGIGGIRLGFEEACRTLEFRSKCIFSSEIKPHAISVYKENFKDKKIHGDITKIDAKNIPDFD